MIHFPRIQTPRLNVHLRELTIGEAVNLASTPLGKHEVATAALLASIVMETSGPNNHAGRWTVQERMFVVAHYIACTSDVGNFEIGDGRFLDYLQTSPDTAPESVDVGQACGDTWHMRQLTGDEALAMEQVCTSHLHWQAADMAARLYVPGKEERPDASERPADFTAWLQERKDVFLAMPESDFEALFSVYERGRVELNHLFWLGFDESGHTVLPKATEGGGSVRAPARFPVAAAVGRIAGWLGARAAGQRRIP